jgi:plasmid maintenance system antidote protein VapI
VVVSPKRQRRSPSDTRRLIDDYTLYRFGHVLSAQDLAKQAGVSTEAVENLLAQKPIAPSDLDKISRAIDVSPELLSEIAGYREMDEGMLHTLNKFFATIKQERAAKKARAA